MSGRRQRKKHANRKPGQRRKRKQVQRNVKDRLFRYLFEKDREALLELYNALNGTDYKDSSELEIVTIESAVYVVMKNDLAFANKAARSDVELTVRMLNINYGYNGLLMEKCSVLKEYSEFVDITRKFMLENKHVETALAEAVDYCIEKGILEMFLRKNRAEVLGMLLEEFDVKKYERTLRSEGLEEGMELGRKQGIEQGIRCTIEILQEAGQSKGYVTDKLAEKYALSEEAAADKLLQYWK